MDIKLPAPVVATPEKVTSSAVVVKAETLSAVPTSLNQASTVDSGTEEENDDEDDDDDDWDTFQSFPASTNPEGSGSKTESVTEEETDLPASSSIQDDESKKSPLVEEADDQHLASEPTADTTKEDSVDNSKGDEEETVESSLNEEALLTSENDEISSDDHLVEMKEESVESRKSSEPEIIGVDTKLPSTEADSPALDDLDPQHFEKSVQDDQVECSNEHVSEKTVAENKSEED